MAQPPSKWSYHNNQSVYFPEWKKAPKCTGGYNNGPKTLPCGAPDTTLTSLLRQPFTITWCDRFDRNCVNIDSTGPPLPTEQSLYITLMVDPFKGSTEINQQDNSPLANLPCTLQCMGHAQKCITGIQTFPIGNRVVGSTPQHSINRPRRTDTRNSNTIDNTNVMEIGR